MRFIVAMMSILLFMRISSEDKFDCTGYEDNSFHPMTHTNDCRFYWHCVYVDSVYIRAIKRACPAGTGFDRRTNQCEWTNSIDCQSTTTRFTQLEVLPTKSSSIFLIEQLLQNLMAMKFQSSIINPTTNPIFDSTSVTMSLTTISPPSAFLTSKLKRRHVIHRNNLTLNILTSLERQIRQFPIHQNHGLLIHCNEIRRRQLRDLIFFSSSSRTIITKSSSKILQSDRLLSLTMMFFLLLIFTKISD